MDRTVKNIQELYNGSPVNQQRYILSLAMLGDVKPHTMQDLSRRFRKARQDNPHALARGFQDMQLEGKQGVRSDTKQALHEIKRTGKNVGQSMSIDDALTSHFATLGHAGMLTRVLEAKTVQSMTERVHSADESRRMKLQKSHDDNDTNDDDDSNGQQHTPSAKRSTTLSEPDDSARPEQDMNRTNRLRHTEEQDETESKVARANKEKRDKMQKQMKGKQPHW